MNDDVIYIGDLVKIKEQLLKFIALPEWGITVDETTITAADLNNGEDFEPIACFLVFFPTIDDTIAIPKNCLKKMTVIQE